MKNTCHTKACIMLFGAGVLLSGAVKAQQTATRNQLHLKITQESDGKKIHIDTFIEHAETFDINVFLADRGVEVPPVPGSPMQVYIIGDSEDGDDKNKRVVTRKKTTTNVTTTCSRKGVLPLVPPFPPAPPVPPATPADEPEEISEGAGKKEIRIMTARKAYIKDMDDSDKTLPGKDDLVVEQLRIYPNPGNGKFRLSFELPAQKALEVTIRNKEGKVIYSERAKALTGSYDKEIDLSGEYKGIYFLEVMQGKKLLQKKIVIE